MRVAKTIIVLLITATLVFVLDRPLGKLPPLGRLLDPLHGWAANAEATDKDFNATFSLTGLQQPVAVWFEARMVPHIHAQNDHDLYYTLGYVHAYFRLWQMDLQTRAAAGRIGEVVGEKWVKEPKTGKEKNVILEFDRSQRRKGMVYGAENSLKTMEADPQTHQMLDAYTAGINQYIQSLSYKELPLEYKLMDFTPEPWTNLKCALLMKTMADDLTGYTEDFPLTVLKNQLSEEDFKLLFPLKMPNSIPVIPSGTSFEKPSLPTPQIPDGQLWATLKTSPTTTQKKAVKTPTPQYASFYNQQYDLGIGSNNWAISGSKTQSGAAILCNDPHLGLNLPSLWFEVQLQAPGINVYGVSLPGAPGIIIGFNDSISWGLTNNYRDVKDFYEIEKIDNNSYRFDGKPRVFDKRIELIKIKGNPDFVDKVNYTIHGPVMYDETFEDPASSGKNIALTWMAHRGTNELKAVYLLNKARNYQEFTAALMHFQCPAQNIVYADRQNNIALWGQGQFINKWKDQGRYVMNGNTAATLWGSDIPMRENPHAFNPTQQYLASANQMTTDSTYPYWYNGYFSDFREWRVNEMLQSITQTNVNEMMKMQNDVQSFYFEKIGVKLRTLLKENNNTSFFSKNWIGEMTAKDSNATKFEILMAMLYKNIWEDEFATIPQQLFPEEEKTMQLLLTDSNSKFYDDRRTPQKETLKDIVKRGCEQTEDSLSVLRKKPGTLEWYLVKGAQLTHLAKIDAFSYLNLEIGGTGKTINAVKKKHGPSWRMIVEMGKEKIKAYGVYPGGQSGNPGSKYYGTFVNKWTAGNYYELLFLSPADQQKNNNAIKYTWTITAKR